MSEENIICVRNVMTPSPVMVDGLATISEAAALLREHGISCVVVDKRHDGDEYGLLSIPEIANHIVSQERAAERVSVYELMTKPVVSVDVAMNIKYAVRLLVRYNLTRALVLDAGKVAGIVTLRDLALAALEE